jgi:hypothetical protein
MCNIISLVIKMILHIILTHLGRLKVITRLDDISFSHKNDITHQQAV